MLVLGATGGIGLELVRQGNSPSNSEPAHVIAGHDAELKPKGFEAHDADEVSYTHAERPQWIYSSFSSCRSGSLSALVVVSGGDL